MLHALIGPAWKGVLNGLKSVTDMCQCRVLQACRNDVASLAKTRSVEESHLSQQQVAHMQSIETRVCGAVVTHEPGCDA